MSITADTVRGGRPWFGLIFVGACVLLVAFGFSFTFLPDVIGRLRPAVLYLHVASAASWLCLLLAQAWLARSRKLARHRQIGKYGFALGALAAISAFATALVLRHDAVVAHPGGHRIARIAFLAIPLNGAIAFSVLLACAWAWRSRPEMHRRCMMLAAAVLTLPAVARVPVIGEGPWAAAPTILLLLTLGLADIWRNKRLHRVYLFGIPAILALQFATQWLFLAAPAWWVAAAAWLCGVPAA